MQKMLCLLSRESAKLVPMVSVAGRAGGTTIVIKSRARMIIKCQASWFILLANTAEVVFKALTYTQSNKVNE